MSKILKPLTLHGKPIQDSKGIPLTLDQIARDAVAHVDLKTKTDIEILDYADLYKVLLTQGTPSEDEKYLILRAVADLYETEITYAVAGALYD